MVTVDKLEISVNYAYANRQQLIEEFNRQIRIDQASSIPPQTHILNIYPKLSELEMLLGIISYHTPWAYFFPPKKFRFLRRSPFAFHRIAPSLGSLQEQEEIEELLANLPCKSPEEKQEKEVIQACFKQINKINSWLGFIVGRIGQFLQG